MAYMKRFFLISPADLVESTKSALNCVFKAEIRNRLYNIICRCTCNHQFIHEPAFLPPMDDHIDTISVSICHKWV